MGDFLLENWVGVYFIFVIIGLIGLYFLFEGGDSDRRDR